MFRFANSIYLYLLLLIPLLTVVYALMVYKTKRQVKKFGDPELMRELMPDVSIKRRHTKFFLMMLAVGLLVLVLARPQYGSRNEEVKRSGIEVAIAVDVSNSMLCKDVSPSRLEKSKMIVSKLVEQFDEDKVGLVAFAGNALTLLPMTSDYVSAKMFLDQLTPATVSLQGTNVADAITKATAGFSKKTNVGRALILITDAEDNEEGAIEAAKQARKEGIQIFVLSVGTQQGGPILMPDGTFKKDLSGNVVTTKLNEQIGKSIAQAGGGLYIHVDQTDMAQVLLEKEIEKMQKEDISQSMYSAYDEQFVAVALLLFIVLLMECCIMERENHVFKKFRLFR
ncbi:MAG: VWA domain-containing protein [Bacteroidaceae bacterium]|nr:VWA domain-containing protein [Bacteroidaceae bacterium]